MKNVRETHALPFIAVVSSEQRQEMLDTKTIPESLSEITKALGVTRYDQTVNFKMTLGSVLFDIYDAVVPAPKAPLAAERERQKRMDLAKLLEQDEFDLPSDFKARCKEAMNNDEAWEKISFSASFEHDGKVGYMQFTNAALDIYREVRTALVTEFLEGQ